MRVSSWCVMLTFSISHYKFTTIGPLLQQPIYMFYMYIYPLLIPIPMDQHALHFWALQGYNAVDQY
jgi:hypothetical protein